MWNFEKYQENSVKRDSSSEKFFKDQEILESIVREFVQNSLDAKDHPDKPVEITFNQKTLPLDSLKELHLDRLLEHVKSSGLSQKLNKEVEFLIIEDFNTTGLEGDKLHSFFYGDNITNKDKGGGSHGIGKAVFIECSNFKAIFGHSNFSGGSTFKGKALLKSHRLNNEDYRPDGFIDLNSNNALISRLFRRKPDEKGLSIAIIYPKEKDIMDNIYEIVMQQCYIPIILKKLIVVVDGKTLGHSEITEIKNVTDHAHTAAKCYKPNIPTIRTKISRDDWKSKTGLSKTHDLANQIQKTLPTLGKHFALNILVSVELIKSQTNGRVLLMIQKKEEDDKKENVHYWRDDVLIKQQASIKTPDEFNIVVFVSSNRDSLGQLLRKLEDPGHLKWNTGDISEDIIKEFGRKTSIRKLVNFITKLPHLCIKYMSARDSVQDRNLLSDYFPKISDSDSKVSTHTGNSKESEDKPMPDVISNTNEISLQNFKPKSFELLINKTHFKVPFSAEMTLAYGTNFGNPFNQYDKNDFVLGKDVSIVHKNGSILEQKNNSLSFKVENKDFTLKLAGFCKRKELKIEVNKIETNKDS